MSLCLHAGAELVPYDALCAVATPVGTNSHVPVAHHEIVELMRYTLGFFGHEVTEEHHAILPDGSRYFGLLSLKSQYGEYEDTIGLRNSHDKSFPIGIAFGSRTFVCDNMAFSGDTVIKRKHTIKAKRELPGLVAEIIQPLADQRKAQHMRLVRYAATPMADQLADHVLMELYRTGVVNLRRIPAVMEQWNEPEHDWGDKTAWRMFNATTFALTGKVAEAPHLTRQLHTVLDGVCEEVTVN